MTVFGGCLSFILMVTFIGIFASSLLDTLNKVEVEATTHFANDPTKGSQISGFPIAVGFPGLFFDDTYFTIEMKVKYPKNVTVVITM